MDRLIYTAMTGAKATMGQEAAVAHNLANATTTGFRAEVHRLRAVPVQSQALPSKAFVVDASIGADYTPGTIVQTGRSLDAAINGKGWFAVQMADGSEAYTRSGSFTIDAEGVLRTRSGLEVVGDSGPISIPPDNTIDIAADGSINATPTTGALTTSNVVARLKLVNPDEANLDRGENGLFKMKDGSQADADPLVRVAGGYLEGSNVNVVEQMVTMISLARQYDLNTRLLQAAQDNDKAAAQILSLT
ncbi:flagellar basal-body rod protein FlgF [Uliginosibacterium gangwonense]|uniref:flagellar basal-body rod protein FlgF n=1 Tax=Uliginosibacterium gangwonense TaxID=392736 RepID=UPI0003723FA3|nr:flagellar basal-body rod protein FlgF [Uliginosibacterium gangwonense]